MRINRFIAASTGLSRRKADSLIQSSKVFINDLPAKLTDHVTSTDKVVVDKKRLFLPIENTTIILNKPKGYVCSRDGQGSKTVYELLPVGYAQLKPVGRLDKDSSGLLIMTDDGQLAHELTHPKFNKQKIYEVSLTKPLSDKDKTTIKQGVMLDDGISKLGLKMMNNDSKTWEVTMQEGRNRQIRRTFSALNYHVKDLRRVSFGPFALKALSEAEYKKV